MKFGPEVESSALKHNQWILLTLGELQLSLGNTLPPRLRIESFMDASRSGIEGVLLWSISSVSSMMSLGPSVGLRLAEIDVMKWTLYNLLVKYMYVKDRKILRASQTN